MVHCTIVVGIFRSQLNTGPRGQLQEKSTITAEQCQVKPRTDWSSQEQWIWKQVCKNKTANFNEGSEYGGSLSPQTEGWPATRVLTPKFLETILLYEPFRSAIPHHGVRIIGAKFEQRLDLSDATLAHPLGLLNCRFEAGAHFIGLKTPYQLVLSGSKFTGPLNMDSIRVEDSLYLSGGAEFEAVVLRSARIDNQLTMIGSQFKSLLSMDGLKVGNALVMREAEFSAIDLQYGKINGPVEMTNSTFTGPLNMSNIQVESNLIMGNTEKSATPVFRYQGKDRPFKRLRAEFADVTLNNARITGTLNMRGSHFLVH